MTEFNDDKQKAQEKKSFKEQILRELEEANRQRKLREEELYQKELEAKAAARRTAELMAEYEAQRLKEEEEAKAFTPPSWFGEDVTFSGEYHNSRLSKG